MNTEQRDYNQQDYMYFSPKQIDLEKKKSYTDNKKIIVPFVMKILFSKHYIPKALDEFRDLISNFINIIFKNDQISQIVIKKNLLKSSSINNDILINYLKKVADISLPKIKTFKEFLEFFESNNSNPLDTTSNTISNILDKFASIKMISLTISNYREYLKSFLELIKEYAQENLSDFFLNSLFVMGITKILNCRNLILQQVDYSKIPFPKFKDTIGDYIFTLINQKLQINFELDRNISRGSLVDLHTHLMGLGNADFWVDHIMKGYLINRRNNSSTKEFQDVEYNIEHIYSASNFPSLLTSEQNNISWKLSLIQSRMLSELDLTLNKVVQSKVIEDKTLYYITNSKLVELIELEQKVNGKYGPIESMVRNWFEFLNADGTSPSHCDILNTYRGNFTPEFYPRRFIMKDDICKICPEVLSILLNVYNNRYNDAGVKYVEFSVSANDLQKENIFNAITDNVFYSSHPLFKKEKTSTLKKKKVVVDEDEEEVLADEEEEAEEEASKVPEKTMIEIFLPKISLNSAKPLWRKQYSEYKNRPPSFLWCFLAAFNRGTISQYPSRITNKEDGTSQTIEFSSYDKDTETGPAKLFAFISNIKETINNPDINTTLFQIAFELCSNDNLNIIFEKSKESFLKFTNAFNKKESSLQNAVVGIDWVGDEFGFPFCYLCHSDVLKEIKNIRKNINKNFGIRIHAGEGLIRPPQCDSNRETDIMFKLHIYILIHTIYKIYCELNSIMVPITDWIYKPNGIDDFITSSTISSSAVSSSTVSSSTVSSSVPSNETTSSQHNQTPSISESTLSNDKKKCNIRIGHGIAFLYRDDNPKNKDFNQILSNFRQFLSKANIPCELNPTSNHMLVPATFHEQNRVSSNETLSAFLKEEIPVILCTDDDGVWSIEKCKIHNKHISVSHEYCEVIQRNEIKNIETLNKLIQNGRSYAFAMETNEKYSKENKTINKKNKKRKRF